MPPLSHHGRRRMRNSAWPIVGASITPPAGNGPSQPESCEHAQVIGAEDPPTSWCSVGPEGSGPARCSEGENDGFRFSGEAHIGRTAAERQRKWRRAAAPPRRRPPAQVHAGTRLDRRGSRSARALRRFGVGCRHAEQAVRTPRRTGARSLRLPQVTNRTIPRKNRREASYPLRRTTDRARGCKAQVEELDEDRSEPRTTRC